MADEYYGYVGTLLKVNLTDMTVEKIPTNTYDTDKWIGGRGLGSIIQWTECPTTAGALDPENVLTFLTGSLTGTMLDGGRTFVQAVSPAGYPDTGSFARSSFGSSFAPEMKFAGYDGIIFMGKAPYPVYFYINDDIAEIRDARDLWGMDNFAVQNELYRRSGNKAKIASIGPCRRAHVHVLHHPVRRVVGHGHGLLRCRHGLEEPEGHLHPGYRLREGRRSPGPARFGGVHPEPVLPQALRDDARGAGELLRGLLAGVASPDRHRPVQRGPRPGGQARDRLHRLLLLPLGRLRLRRPLQGRDPA